MKTTAMASITVRNVPDEVHRALRVRAATHGRSTEAEIREILESAVKPQERLRMGDALAGIGRNHGLEDQDLAFERDRMPAKPLRLR
jgi:antitoxin FitA